MNRLLTLLSVLLLALGTGGCDLVGDIIEFGFWLIVILVVVVMLLGWGLIRMIRGRSRRRRP